MIDDKPKQSTDVNPFIKKRVNSFFIKEKAKIKTNVNVNRILADYQKSRKSKSTQDSSFGFPFDTTKVNPANTANAPAGTFKVVKKRNLSSFTTPMIPVIVLALIFSVTSFSYPNFFLAHISILINLCVWGSVIYRYNSKNNKEKVWLSRPPSDSLQSSYTPPTPIHMSLASHYSPSTPPEVKEKIDSLINSALKINIQDLPFEDFRYLKTTFEVDLPQLYKDINWDTLQGNEAIKEEMLSVLSSIEEKVFSMSQTQSEAASKDIKIQLNYLKRKSSS